MNDQETCPVCGEKGVSVEYFSERLSYKEVSSEISTFKRSRCSCCECVFATSAQSRHNKLAVVNFRRDVDGIMKTYEIRELRLRLGLTVKQASDVVGGGGNAFSKYESGDISQSIALDNLLRLLKRDPKILSALLSIEEQRRQEIESVTFVSNVEYSPATLITNTGAMSAPRGAIRFAVDVGQEVFSDILNACVDQFSDFKVAADFITASISPEAPQKNFCLVS